MRSAFGVFHPEEPIHKGVPKGLVAAAGKTKAQSSYPLERLRAHNQGKLRLKGGEQSRTASRRYLDYVENQPTRKLP